MKRFNPLLLTGAIVVIALVVFVVVRSTRKGAPAVAEVTSTQPVPMAANPPESAPQSSTSAMPPLASPRGTTALPPPPVTPPQVLQEREPTKEEVAHIPRIAPEELLEAYNNKSVTIIDVRDADSYKERHIPGAMHIPLAYIQGEIPYLPKDKPIVTYCT
jgi:hypothetical protein